MATFWVSTKSPSTSTGTEPAGFSARNSGDFSPSASRICSSKGWPVQHRSMWIAVEQAPGLVYSFMQVGMRAGDAGRGGAGDGGSGARLEPLHPVEGVVADGRHLVGVGPAGIGDGMGGEMAGARHDFLALPRRQRPVALGVQGH